MGMIIWPGEMEFWERREAAQKQLREGRERQAKQDAAWWRFVQEPTEVLLGLHGPRPPDY